VLFNVRGAGVDDACFTIPISASLGASLNQFCTIRNLQKDDWLFTFKGAECRDSDTPLTLGMKNGDALLLQVRQ
jgi:hypothetical protein